MRHTGPTSFWEHGRVKRKEKEIICEEDGTKHGGKMNWNQEMANKGKWSSLGDSSRLKKREKAAVVQDRRAILTSKKAEEQTSREQRSVSRKEH